MADAALVTQIKEGQRASQEWKQAWWNYCDTHGEGKRDPGSHASAFLQTFIDGHVHLLDSSAAKQKGGRPTQIYGAPVPSAEHQHLVNQVKQVQQSSQHGKQQWANWCIQCGGGNRDPARHEVSFLKKFLNMQGIETYGFGMGTMPMHPMQMHPAMHMHMMGSPVGPVKEKLVKQIKEQQRSSPELKQEWQDYCQKYGQGRHDPMRHDVGFLQQFIALQDEATKPVSIKRSKMTDTNPMLGGGYPMPGMSSLYDYQHDFLVKQIKDGQRISEDFKQSWWTWCDSYGGGKRDPSKHPTAFLQEYVSTRSNMGTVQLQSDDPVRQGLVKKIKEGQQKSQEWKEAWANYCTSTAQGNRDPNRHDNTSLEKFIEEHEHLLS
mmetsp:Transcript_54930/g.97814  ORF Transcript_54930/g.97814 Transcript_54930/m.97814 type:complete len:377 (-) Transcript_54930:1142-2272(-)